jgi:phosphopantetheinyl transferase (holo-ACP synthase)
MAGQPINGQSPQKMIHGRLQIQLRVYGALLARQVLRRDSRRRASEQFITEAQMAHPTTTTGQHRYVTGIFNDKESAERAYQLLRQRGYTDKEINIMMSDDTRKRHFGKAGLGSKTLEGAGAGSAVGGTAGAVIGAIVGAATSIALPGIGLVIAGPLAGALAGAGAGGLTGGLVGALVGAGIPEDRAKLYESGIKAGGIFMSVKPRNDADARLLQDEWRQQRADHVHY